LSCDKQESNRDYPRINTLKIERITPDGVWIKGEIFEAGNYNLDDHGFVYVLSDSVTSGVNFDWNAEARCFEKLSLGSGKGDIQFEAKLSRNLWTGKTYIAKAFAESNNKYVYGEEVEFLSQGGSTPEIISFSPDTASYGDTISIIGRNFSMHINYNKLMFSNQGSEICYASDTLLKVIVPKEIKSGVFPLEIFVASDSNKSQTNFVITPPRIDSLSSEYILSTMDLDVFGKNFSDVYQINISDKILYYNFKKISDRHLKIKIPSQIPLGKLPISFKFLDQEINFPNSIESIKPTIESVRPYEIWIDSILQIRGTHLDYLPSLTYQFGTVQYKSDSLFLIKVQSILSSNKISGQYNNEQIIAEDSIKWLPPVIKSISRDTALNGETIRIEGDRFINDLTAFLGEKGSKATYINKNVIKFDVPEIEAGTYPIELKHYSNLFNVQSTFSIHIPQIEILDVNPQIIQRNDIVNISLGNINMDKWLSVYIEGKWCDIVEIGTDYINIKVKNEVLLSDSPKLTINNGGRSATYNHALQSVEPWKRVKSYEFVSGFTTVAYPNDTPILLARKNSFEGLKLYQHIESTEEWKPICDYELSGEFPSVFSKDDKMYFVRQDEDEQARSIISIDSYSLTQNDWKHEGKFEYNGVGGKLIVFEKDNKVYIGTTDVMKSFDLMTKQWKDNSIISTNEWRLNRTFSFVINNKCFVGFNNDDRINNDSFTEFWEYHTETDSWDSVDGCPLNQYYGSSVCYDNEKAYFFTKINNTERDFWVYNPDANTWDKYFPPAGRSIYGLSFISNNSIYLGQDENYNRNILFSKINLNELIKIGE